MKVKFLGISFLLVISEGIAWAAGKEGAESGGGSLKDLLAPTINFLIFFGVLYWILKDVVVGYFSSLEKNVVEVYHWAQSKKRESAEKLKDQRDKLDRLHEQREVIEKEGGERVKRFAEECGAETKKKIVKWRESLEMGLEADKAFLTRKLQEKLLDSVISKSSDALKRDKALGERATKKLLKDIS